jgi:probable phosphomutase (TIGR03848 family)
VRQLILLIRHATAEYKPGRLYGWTPGVHLSAQGRDEAKHLAERLEPVRLNALYSSPLERCVETAEAVAAGRRVDIRIEERLGEVQYGSWQGRTFRSLVKTPLWRVVQLAPSQATFPGGESLLQLQRRGVEAIEDIRTRHRRAIVGIVSHADMIKAMLAHYLGLHLDLFQRISVDTASVSAIAFSNGFPRVLRISDTGDYESFKLPKAASKRTKAK